MVIPWVVRLYVDYLTYRRTTMEYLSYTTYISVDLAYHEKFHAKVNKGGIKSLTSSLSHARTHAHSHTELCIT